MKKNLITLCFCGCLLYGNAQPDSTQLSLQKAEQIFISRNLTLIAERYNIDIAQAKITQVKLWDNPSLSLEQNIYNRLNDKYFDVGKDGEASVEIEQIIQIAGQRNKRIKLEKINKENAKYQFEEVLRTLKSKLRETCIEIYFDNRSVKVYDTEIAALKLLLNTYQEQHQKGNLSLLEISRLEALLFSLDKDKSEITARLIENKETLNLLLNYEAGKPISPIIDTSVADKYKLEEIPYNDLCLTLTERPDIKISHTELQASKANLKLQKSMAAPEFAVKGIYDRAGNFINNYFAIGINISIPLFDRNQGNIKAARFDIQKKIKEKDLSIEKARSEVYATYSQLKRALQLYRSGNSELENNFDTLISGVNENFKLRNINMLEFIDYYESYKEVCLQLCESRKNVFLLMEKLNTLTGKNIFNY